jgi:S1-C subfamily serine protease
MLEDLNNWVKMLKDTLKILNETLIKIEDDSSMEKVDYDFLGILKYSMKLFDTAYREISVIVVDITTGAVNESHITRLRQIAKSSHETSNSMGAIWNNDTRWKDYDKKWFRLTERLYCESRDTCNDMIDISNLAGRLNDFIGVSLKPSVKVELEESLKKVWILESEESMSQGTAFVVENYGVVTCSHVLTPGTEIFQGANLSKKYPIRIVKENETIDAALIEIQDADLKDLDSLTIGNPDDISIQDDIYVIGYPNFRAGDSGIIHPGKITGFRTVSGVRRLLTNAPIISGNSGGPVLDSKGNVIGIAATGADSMIRAMDTEFHSIIPINALDLF